MLMCEKRKKLRAQNPNAQRGKTEHKMKKILLVARDIAPSEALILLSERLISQRVGSAQDGERLFFTECQVGKGKDLATPLPTILEHIANADAVVVGMSSSEALAKEELAVASEAIRLGKPVFCYADTFGLRPYFKDVLDAPGTTLFHLNDDEAAAAKTVYPTLEVVTTGNPMWERFFFPKFTRDQVREQLGISEGVKVILCPGGKDKEVNSLHFIQAVEDLGKLDGVHFIISLHRGDTTPPEYYHELLAGYGVWFQIMPSSSMSGLEILPCADLVYGSASTIEVAAVCLRIPVVDYLSQQARERLKRNTGSSVWELVTQGVVHDRDDFMDQADSLYYVVENVSIIILQDPLRSDCKKLYPKPEKPGVALDRMVNAIEARLS